MEARVKENYAKALEQQQAEVRQLVLEGAKTGERRKN